jgi:hypothetical protein
MVSAESAAADDLRASIVERESRIVGLIPPRSGLWLEPQSNSNLLVERFVESHAVICRDVDPRLRRLKRHRSGAAIVFRGVHRPRARDIDGVITQRAIADTVSTVTRIDPGSAKAKPNGNGHFPCVRLRSLISRSLIRPVPPSADLDTDPKIRRCGDGFRPSGRASRRLDSPPFQKPLQIRTC